MPLIVDVHPGRLIVLNGARLSFLTMPEGACVNFLGPAEVISAGRISQYGNNCKINDLILSSTAIISINCASISARSYNEIVQLTVFNREAKIITPQHDVRGLPKDSPAGRLYKAVRAIAELPPPDMIRAGWLNEAKAKYVSAKKVFVDSTQNNNFAETLDRHMEQGNFHSALRHFRELAPQTNFNKRRNETAP